MTPQEQHGWDLAFHEFLSGKKRSQRTFNELSKEGATAYDEHWTQIDNYLEKEQGN